MEEERKNNINKHFHRIENGHSLDDYKRDRAFPHITDQYNYRINNRILLSKIINPRRDKTIMDSLSNTSYRFLQQKKKKALDPRRCALKRRNYTSNLGNPNDKQFKTQQSEHGQQEQRHTSKTHQQSTNIKPEAVEEEIKIEQICLPTSQQNKTAEHTTSTRENSLRNNFVGRIIKNLSKDNLELNKNLQMSTATLRCDLTASYYVNSGIICKNYSKQNLQGTFRPKIKRILRPVLKDYLQSKEMYSMSEDKVSSF